MFPALRAERQIRHVARTVRVALDPHHQLRTEIPRLRLGVIQHRGAAVDPHPSALAVEAHEQ